MGSTSAPKTPKDPMTDVLAEHGAKEWERYKQDFSPVESKFIDSAMELGSASDTEQLTGRGLAELRQQSGPSTPSGKAELVDRSLGTMDAESKMRTSADLESLDRKGKGLKTAISLGRDIGEGALGEISRQSQLNTQKGIADARAKGIRQQGQMDAIGTAAGFAAYSGLNKPQPTNITHSTQSAASGGQPMGAPVGTGQRYRGYS